MDKVWNLPGTIKQGLEWAAHVSDTAPRLAEFKALGGASEGEIGKESYKPADPEARASATSGAREVTLDYDRNGSQTKVMRALTPFMNIGIQGTDRLVRAFKEDPAGYASKAAMAITLPTIVNWAINHNDSRYQNAPQWEKDLYWLFPKDKWEPAVNPADAISRPPDLRRQNQDGTWEVNNGTTFKISKPFELGVLFGSLPERLLNKFFTDNPHELTDFLATVGHGLLPNVMPAVLNPVLEQASNHNFFTGRPVISSHAEGLVPELQYNEYTSLPAKQLGKLLGYVPGIDFIGPKDAKLRSPMVIDNYIHDWGGTMGQYALQIAGRAANWAGLDGDVQKPAATLADMPVIKAFISRNPGQNLQPIQDFYDSFEKANRLNASINDLMKKGDPASVQQAMAMQKDNAGDLTRLTAIHAALGAQSKVLQYINAAPTSVYKADEKRQLMDSAYYQMSMIAKQGNQIIDARRKSINAQQ